MPLRDILVTLIFAVGVIYALKRPYYGGLLWVWIGVMNPHRLGWGFAYSMPFAMGAAAVTMVSMLFHAKELQWPRGTPVVLLIMLTLWMGVTTGFAIHPDLSLVRYIDLLKVIIMTIAIGMMLRSSNEIIGLIWVIVLSLGYFGIKGGVFTLTTGGAFRVWGPPSSVIASNNEFAVALIMAIPLMYFLAQEAKAAARFPVLDKLGPAKIKLGMYAAMVLCAISAVGSQSRGALVAIIAMSAMLWWRSKSKVTLAIVLFLLAPIGLMSMPDHWFERMSTIGTYQEDASAMGRITAWETSARVANDRLTGAGFAFATGLVYAMYGPGEGPILVAHSIYFQMLGSHGYVGLGLYLLFWLSTYLTAGRLVRRAKDIPELAWASTFGSMAKVSIVGFLVGGAFLDMAYWDVPYYLMIALVVSNRLITERLRELQQGEATGPAVSPNHAGALATSRMSQST